LLIFYCSTYVLFVIGAIQSRVDDDDDDVRAKSRRGSKSHCFYASFTERIDALWHYDDTH